MDVRTTPEELARFEAPVAEVGDEAWVGHHGHQNMSLGIANSVIACESGVRCIDGSLCALGAGSGNSPREARLTAHGASVPVRRTHGGGA